MKFRSNCCKDCQKRHYKCHSTCEDYAAAKAELEEIKRKKKQHTEIYGYIADVNKIILHNKRWNK